MDGNVTVPKFIKTVSGKLTDELVEVDRQTTESCTDSTHQTD